MPSAIVIEDALQAASALLASAEAKLDAQLLLQHVLHKNYAWLISHNKDTLTAHQHTEFSALLSRRLSGEPVAYILGYREFYGLNLKVTPDTLIPRSDTEILVEAALQKISIHRSSKNFTLLDLGTGSGAIALAIAKNCPQINITAVDASKNALAVAKENAQKLGIRNVKFVLSDWFKNLTYLQFDMIVSNPPYIEQNDAHLTQGDLRFEPISALASGEDGLQDIRRILHQVLLHLKPQGWLILEHGYNQAQATAELMAETGLTDVVTLNDFGGNQRVTMGKNSLIASTHWNSHAD